MAQDSMNGSNSSTLWGHPRWYNLSEPYATNMSIREFMKVIV